MQPVPGAVFDGLADVINFDGVACGEVGYGTGDFGDHGGGSRSNAIENDHISEIIGYRTLERNAAPGVPL